MKKNKKLPKAKILKYLEIVAPMLPAPIYWEDVDSRVLGANQQILDGIGATWDVVGKLLYDFHPYDIAKPIVEHNEEVMSTGKILAKEEMIKDIITGECRWYAAVKSPLRDDTGQIIGLIGTSVEITEQKNAEQQLRIEKTKAEAANLAKSEFISSISHEFRTPLNSMMGMTQLVALTVQDKETKLKLNEIMRAGEHLLGLITDILDFSKLESEKFDLTLNAFSLAELLSQVTKQLSYLLEDQAHLRLEAITDAAIPEYLLGDTKCVRQILFNLVGNAIKFTKKGSINVKVNLLSISEGAVRVKVEVVDTGIGIAKDKLGLLFERFSQVDSSYDRQYSGVGLGLAITKKLVDRMAGRIGVDSKEGVGSRFWCELDFTIANAEQILDAKTREAEVWSEPVLAQIGLDDQKEIVADLEVKLNPELLINKHVLVIEDDPNRLNQLVITGMIESFGGKAVVFHDAASVLAYLNNNMRAVDLILTDIGLPDMNGVELMQKIRQDIRYQACPIVAVTGFSSTVEIKRFLEAGANDIITKPISLIKLKACVQHYLSANINVN